MPILVIQPTLLHSPASERSDASVHKRIAEATCPTMANAAVLLRIITAKSRRPAQETQQKAGGGLCLPRLYAWELSLWLRRFAGGRLRAGRGIGRVRRGRPVRGIGAGAGGRARHVGAGGIGAGIVGRGRPDPEHVAGDRDAREQKRADQDAQDRAAGGPCRARSSGIMLSHLQPFETGLSGEQQGSALSGATPDRRRGS